MTPTSTTPTAPAGWHPDPWHLAAWRWWDGAQWTAHVWPHPGGDLPWASPAWAHATPGAPRRELRRAFWPSVGWMLLAMLAGIVASVVPAVVAAVLGAGERTILSVVVFVFYPVMFGGFWLASRKLSQVYGTGDMRTDYGWRQFRRADIGWGVLAAVAAVLVQVVIGLVLPQPDDGSYREAVFGKNPSLVLLIGMGIAVVVGAPLFEELMFRGPIMTSLIARFGTWPGLIVQGAVFALYHVVGNPTMITAWYLAPLFAVGIILGVAAQRTGRMATSQIAHAVMNTVAFVGLLLSL